METTSARENGWHLPHALHMGIRSPDTPLLRATLGTDDPLVHIDHAAKLGLAGIADNMLRLRPPEVQAAMGERLRAHGLRFGSFVVSPAEWPRLWWGRPGEENAARIRSEISGCIKAAQRVGAEVLTITSMADDTIAFDRQLDAMAAHLDAVLPIAADAGLRFGLETVSRNRVPDLLLRHLRDAMHLVAGIGHPALGLVFDTHHVRAMDGDLMASAAAAAGHVFSIQIADFPERFEPGTGEIDFVPILSDLHEQNSDALVEWEFYAAGKGVVAEAACITAVGVIDRKIRHRG